MTPKTGFGAGNDCVRLPGIEPGSRGGKESCAHFFRGGSGDRRMRKARRAGKRGLKSALRKGARRGRGNTGRRRIVRHSAGRSAGRPNPVDRVHARRTRARRGAGCGNRHFSGRRLLCLRCSRNGRSGRRAQWRRLRPRNGRCSTWSHPQEHNRTLDWRIFWWAWWWP